MMRGLIALVFLAACVSAPTKNVSQDGGSSSGVFSSVPPAQCTNCGLDPSKVGVKVYDPNATY